MNTRVVNADAGIVLVEIGGRIRSANLEPLTTELEKLCRTPRVKLILDVRGIESIDSSGIGELIQARSSAAEVGGCMVLIGASSRVETMIKLAGLTNYFSVVATEDEAIEEVNKPVDPSAM